MRKILGLLALCLLLTSCECDHDGSYGNKERVFETEICTCIETKTFSDHSITYSFVGEKVPVKIDVNIAPNRGIITPRIGGQYKIRYSWWRCPGCQKKGTYRIQDGMILEDLNDKN